MSVFAEFVGGPWDGKLEQLPSARSSIYVADPRPRFEGVTGTGDLVVNYPALEYVRSARRTPDAPTGEPVFRYVLVREAIG